MSNEVILRFCIWGFEDISHDEISKTLGVNPTKIYIKGQKKNPNFLGVAKENGWLIEQEGERYASFEEKLIPLLQFLERKKDVIKGYSQKYTCEISCGVYIYYNNGESIPSIHLSSEYNKIVRDIDLGFDIDIICLPN